MKLTLGFSPCPNDTFIFDALVNKKIDTEGLEFEIVLEDVQTLNNWAKEDKLALSKISYGVLPLITRNYVVLNSGGALGKGVGPLLITNDDHFNADNSNSTVAIPGENTTAHMLFSLAYPQLKNKHFKVFNEIEDAVLTGATDGGVIIHENRFTYQQKGLKKVVDLGEYWEQQLNVPIPLGGIVAKRSLSIDVIKKVDRLIRKSLEYSFDHYPAVTDYVRAHAQEMSEDVMRQHIDLYVNNYSIDLGAAGKKAVEKLLEVYQQLHPETSFDVDNVFI
ncbi:1,4-dihydroxy-6-naphthoate synthase [Chitinophagaceae bacterium LWZ2-11]